MAVDRRATGWLDEVMHARIREWLCHALGRHELVCPADCLMPDHAHFLWIGLGEESDQKKAAMLFRESWNEALRLRGCELQRQAHDHILRENERERGGFGAVANYVFENPMRAGLVQGWRDYRYLGAVVPGYPRLDAREADYWETLWRIYEKLHAFRYEVGVSPEA